MAMARNTDSKKKTTPKTDKQGRPYAQLSKLKAGAIVTLDADFTCIKPWAQREVYEDKDHGRANANDKYFIYCTNGRVRHYLSGQLDRDGDSLIGVYHGVVPAPPKEP